MSRTCALRVAVVGMPWPVETFIDRLLGGLSRAGLDVAIFGSRSPTAEWLEGGSFSWHPSPWNSPVEVMRSGAWRELPGTARSIASRRGLGSHDVLYVPWINVAAEHPEIFELGVPVVVSCRGSLIAVAPWNPRRAVLRSALRRVFDRATAVHCVADAIADDAHQLGMPRSKATVIRPAVPIDEYPLTTRRKQTGRLRVISIGALNWVKDLESTLGSIRSAVESGVDAELTIVGDGPDRDRVLFSIGDLGLDGRVRLAGRLAPSEVARELRSHDALLHTSCSEGISNAVLEAMASGLPVVTTGVGGMAEAVTHGVEGYLTPVRDWRSAGEALAVLANDVPLRRRMGLAARRRIERDHALEGQVVAFARLLSSSAGRHR